MPNLVVFFALVCTLSARSAYVAGYVTGGIKSQPFSEVRDMGDGGLRWMAGYAREGPFVRVTQTVDGRRKTVVSWGEFLAVEDAEAIHNPGQLYSHQMTNGHDMLLLIFRGRGNLVACELFEDDADRVAEFRRSYSNGTREVEPSEELSKLLDAIDLNIMLAFEVSHPEIDRSIVDWDASEKSCVRLQAAKQKEAESLQKSDKDEGKRWTGGANDEVKVPSRSRRAVPIMWPGTTWCGVGNVSRDNAETEGMHVDTDKCCRQHDMCNYTIEAFRTKYNLLNFRFHTISHCECDDRFGQTYSSTCVDISSQGFLCGYGVPGNENDGSIVCMSVLY